MTLNDAILKAYTKEDLIALYDVYFREWIEKGWVEIPENSPFNASINELVSDPDNTTINPLKVYSVQKKHFIAILEQFYGDGKVFKKIFAQLPEPVQDFFTRVAFEQHIPLSKEDQGTIYTHDYKGYHLIKIYRFFQAKISTSRWGDSATGFLHLHPDIIKSIRPWLPKPENYFLHPVIISDKLHLRDFEIEAVSHLQSYRDFVKTQLKYSKSGLVLKSSYKKFQQNLNVTEFYHMDKRTELLRSQILTEFLSDLEDDASRPMGNAEYLRAIVDLILRDKANKNFSLATLFESHLKGCSSYYDTQEFTAEIFQTLKTVMKFMPSSEWIGFDNIIDSLFYRDLKFQLKNSYYNCYITTYYSYMDEGTSYAQREDITNANFLAYVTRPFFKGLMFLLASLGMVKVAYGVPFSEDSAFKDGSLSYYDGLVAVQVTKLGQYAFGIIDEYDEPESIQSEAVITLNDQRLLITLKGDDPIKQFTVENLAVKRTGMLYQFDYETLYKGAKSAADIKVKLTALFKIAEGNIPANWKALETEVTARINPLKQRTTYVVLELTHDIDLLKVLATDTALKKLIIKAENYIIVAKKTDVSTIKQRLRKYGYFFESR